MFYTGFELHQVSVDLFGGYCNCYILETANFIFIIDTNIESSRLLLEKTLQKLPVTTKEVHVLLTHMHWDHVALAGWLKEKYGAQIHASPFDTRMMSDKPYQFKRLYDRFAPDFPFAQSVKEIYDSEFTFPCRPDCQLSDGDVFADDDFTLIAGSCPGHSCDQFCFYNPQNRLLFSGDSVQGRGYNHHPALYDDALKLKQSLNLFMSLKPKTIYGGHFSVSEPDSCMRYLQQSLNFVDEIDCYVKANRIPLNDLVNKFCNDYGYEYSMHVVSTLNAHVHQYKNN